jgi:uncharacterized protein (TIGR00288 family)
MNNEFVRAPHMGAQPSERPSHNAALLIDFDNVTMGIRSNLGQELRKLLDSQLIKGKVAVQRAYADWRRYPQYIVSLSEASIDLIFAPAYGSSRKNATDIRLAIDALELVFTRPEIGTFILLSGDSDFSSLVLKLKEYGKYVIGVGLQESTSDILVQNCDEYYSYNTLGGLTSAADMPTERLDPWELVVHAIERMVKRKDVMRSDRLKQVMLEIDPTFDEKTAGFTKFNRFLTEAAHRDLIRLRKGESGQYEVSRGHGAARREDTEAPTEAAGVKTAPDSEAATAAAATGREASGPDVPEVALGRAYDELATVVTELFDGSDAVRDSMVKRRLLERDATFDEGALGFNKFNRFLKQADDDGIVSLRQGDDGNFYLTPAKAGKGSSRRGRRGGGGDRGGGGRSDRARQGVGSEPADEGEKGRPAAGAAAAETPQSGGGSAFAAAKKVARRTLGRIRGGPGAPSAPAGAKAAEPGPDTPADDGQSTRSGEKAGEPTKRPATPRGERSGKRPADRSRKQGAERSRKQGADRSRKPRGEQPPKPRADRSQKPREDRSQKRRPERPPKERAERSQKPREEPSRKPRAERSRSRPQSSEPARQSPKAHSQPSPEPTRPPTPEPTAHGPADRPPERRGMGRYRTGSVGRKGPVIGASGPVGGAASSGPAKAESPGQAWEPASPDGASEEKRRSEPTTSASKKPSESTSDPIAHMIRNYSGVGRRTAEALVDRFGAEVFQVIDREPERLTEVLSAARARAVIAARASERSNGGG